MPRFRVTTTTPVWERRIYIVEADNADDAVNLNQIVREDAPIYEGTVPGVNSGVDVEPVPAPGPAPELPPLVTLPKGPASFAMYTEAGNAAVAEMFARLITLPATLTGAELNDTLLREFDKVAETHAEVWDTEVREIVIMAFAEATGRDHNSIYF